MRYAKKALAILLALALGLLALAACGDKEQEQEEKQSIMTLVAVFNAAEGEDGRREYPVEYDDYEGDGTSVWELAMALSELTGLDFTLWDVTEDDAGMVVTWSSEGSLFGLDEREQDEEFLFFDYDSMAWFMLDSLSETIRKNIPATREMDIFYAMEGGAGLVLENLSPPMDFTLETPYMGSAFYFAHMDGRGEIDDDEIPDPSDVNWWGEYGSEAGLLNIINYNDRGMGWSFRFTLDSVDESEDGVAAVDPEDPRNAEYAQFTFHFNMSDETIVVTGGGFDGTYMRTYDAVG